MRLLAATVCAVMGLWLMFGTPARTVHPMGFVVLLAGVVLTALGLANLAAAVMRRAWAGAAGRVTSSSTWRDPAARAMLGAIGLFLALAGWIAFMQFGIDQEPGSFQEAVKRDGTYLEGGRHGEIVADVDWVRRTRDVKGVDARDDAGQTPLLKAIAERKFEMADALVQRGADVRAVDASGRGPLYWAARLGKAEAVRLLVKHGAPPDARANDGQTPLHGAVLSGDDRVVRALLDLGADRTLRDGRGRSPADIARLSGDGKLALLIEQHGSPTTRP